MEAADEQQPVGHGRIEDRRIFTRLPIHDDPQPCGRRVRLLPQIRPPLQPPGHVSAGRQRSRQLQQQLQRPRPLHFSIATCGVNVTLAPRAWPRKPATRPVVSTPSASTPSSVTVTRSTPICRHPPPVLLRRQPPDHPLAERAPRATKRSLSSRSCTVECCPVPLRALPRCCQEALAGRLPQLAKSRKARHDAVREAGLEPAHPLGHQDLNRLLSVHLVLLSAAKCRSVGTLGFVRVAAYCRVMPSAAACVAKMLPNQGDACRQRGRGQ